MIYRRGMDLTSWIQAHAGADVFLRLAHTYTELTDDGDDSHTVVDFGQLDTVAGRLIGIVDGLLYLDNPTSPESMPVPQAIEAIQRHVAEYGLPPYGIMACGGFVTAPLPHDPTLVAEIELDTLGVGRQQEEAGRRETEKELAFIRELVASQPCCLCGRIVQPEDGGYDIAGPDTAMGDEDGPWYIPAEDAWRVVCIRHRGS